MLEGVGQSEGQQLDPTKWYDTEAFRKAWWVTEAIPGSFTRLNAAAYWELATRVPLFGSIVEVGVDQGRSASILAEVSTQRGGDLSLHFVDSWESVLIENKAKTEKMLEGFPVIQDRVKIYYMKSKEASKLFADESVDMVHIDAHHYHPSVDIDCESWMPKLKGGGIWAMHDVKATFPDVDETVAKYVSGWPSLGIFDCLGVWIKP